MSVLVLDSETVIRTLDMPESEITVYKSLGNTAQDLAAAHYVNAQMTGNAAVAE